MRAEFNLSGENMEMKVFYFVGGPKPGHAHEFFQRLIDLGSPPAGWQIYPHVADDGKALHVVHAKSMQDILEHLQHFQDIYEYTEIMQVREG